MGRRQRGGGTGEKTEQVSERAREREKVILKVKSTQEELYHPNIPDI